MTRDERLQWIKDRALAYLEDGDLAGALASFTSDAGKDFDGRPEPIIGPVVVSALYPLAMMHVQSNNAVEMHRWITGWN